MPIMSLLLPILMGLLHGKHFHSWHEYRRKNTGFMIKIYVYIWYMNKPHIYKWIFKPVFQDYLGQAQELKSGFDNHYDLSCTILPIRILGVHLKRNLDLECLESKKCQGCVGGIYKA